MIGAREAIADRSSELDDVLRFAVDSRVGLRSRDFPVRAGERFCAELRARKARAGERAEGVVTSREIRSFSW